MIILILDAMLMKMVNVHHFKVVLYYKMNLNVINLYVFGIMKLKNVYKNNVAI